MPRNLNRRVELLFPVEDAELMRRVRDEILAEYLVDNVKARRMQPDGSYARTVAKNGRRVSAQAWLLAPTRGRSHA